MGVNLKDNTYLCRSQLEAREALGLDQEELYRGRLLFLFFLRASSEREGEKHQRKAAHPAMESRHILSTYYFMEDKDTNFPLLMRVGGPPLRRGKRTSTGQHRDQYDFAS